MFINEIEKTNFKLARSLAKRLQARVYSNTDYYKTSITRKFRNCCNEEMPYDVSASALYLHVVSYDTCEQLNLCTYKFDYVSQRVELLNSDCCIVEHVYCETHTHDEIMHGLTFERFEQLVFTEGGLDIFHDEAEGAEHLMLLSEVKE